MTQLAVSKLTPPVDPASIERTEKTTLLSVIKEKLMLSLSFPLA